jgi:hypothetical protein
VGYSLQHLEEIKGLSSTQGTLSQVFIENVHYFRADPAGPDFVADQVE